MGEIISREKLMAAFKAPACTVFAGAAHVWKSANSEVTSSVPLDPRRLFPDTPQLEIAASGLRIRGLSNEPLHYHTSHIVALVMSGSGWLRQRGKTGEETRLDAKAGDIVIIPKDVLHLLETPPDGELFEISLEISPKPINYQKHFHPDTPGPA